MKSPRTRRFAAGVAVALSLTVAGCAQADPRAAARIDGNVISEQDVQTVTREMNQLGLQQQVKPEDALRMLVLGPILDKHNREAGVAVSDQQVREALQKPELDVSAPTMEALRGQVGIMNVQKAQAMAQGGAAAPQARNILLAAQATDDELNKRDDDHSMVLNPKYFHGSDNWIKSTGEQTGAPQQ